MCGGEAGRHDVLDRVGRRSSGPRTGLRARRGAALAAHPGMTRDYVLDQGFEEERARLSGMEALWDPGSQALLGGLGIGPGWRCLEVGAGGGATGDGRGSGGAACTAVGIAT